MLSYIAVVMIGIALIIGRFAGGIAGSLQQLAHILAYLVVGFYSFFYAVRRGGRDTWAYVLLIVGWAVSVTLIVYMTIYLGK
jgi:hypothetical protein